MFPPKTCRQGRFFVFSVLVAVSTLVGSSVAQSFPLQGEWDGELLTPKKPVNFVIRFYSGVAGWTADMDVLGQRGLTMADVSVEGGTIRFSIPEETPLRFTGTFAGGQVTGEAVQDKERYRFTLERIPDLPPPADRVEAWQQDLSELQRRFLRLDKSFSPEAKAAFKQRADCLWGALAILNDAQVTAELARMVALGGNAHTTVYLLRNRTALRRLPFRAYVFADGVYVVRAAPEYQRLLGTRLERAGALTAEQVRARFAELQAGNASWHRYNSAYFFTSPELLYAVGASKSVEQTEITFRRNGITERVTFSAPPLERSEKPVEAWWDLAPGSSRAPQWAAALKPESLAGRLLPMYLRNPEKNYLFEWMPAQSALYVQYNRSQDQGKGDTLQQFGEKLKAVVAEQTVKKLVLDLRFNTGGNLTLAKAWIADLCKSDRLKDARVFLITGIQTFSAGISAVAQWKECRPSLTIVGEHVGDELDTWAEGGNIVLPNSKLTVHFANGFHGYSEKDYPERRPFDTDFNVKSLAPDRLIPFRFADYIRGKDAALEWVMAR